MSQSRFRDRVLVSFLTIIVLPVLTLGVLGPVLYSRTVSDISASHTRMMVDRVTANIEQVIRNQDKLLQMLIRDAALQRFFFQSDPSIDAVIDDRFAAVAASHPEIRGLIAVSEDDRSYSRDLRRILRDPLVDEEWYAVARGSEAALGLVTRPIGRNLRSLTGVQPDEIVSVIRSVRRENSGELAGVLMADLSLEFLESTLEGTAGDDSAFFCILDGQGDFVYAPVNSVVYRINPAWFVNSRQIVERTIGNRGYRFIFAQSPYTGWTTVGVYDLENAMQAVRFVQFSALIIVLITVALTLAISMVYTNVISKPVLHLKSVMEKAGHGDLTVRYDGRSHDEIDDLGEGLNSMLEKIQALMDLVYVEQQSKREAELRILQQQIKPHFLYNTLDTILWMAEENAPDQIVEVVTALTRLFRIALSQGREVVSLADEIDHVRSYLVIQKHRYEDKFDFEILCPDKLRQLQVQKMILQPLVENAIYHGVKETAGPGRITVSVGLRDESLELRVEDDGAGIAEDVLERIREGLKQRDHASDRTAFALYNVNDRIRLTYGDDFGIRISGRPGRGTVVTIRHPVIRETE